MGYRDSAEGSGGLSAECRGWDLRDRKGEKLGKVDEVFVDDNDRPEYLGVKAGLLGGKLTLIPTDIAQADKNRKLIEISASKDLVKNAPVLGSNEEITTERERGIRDHFGLNSGSSESDQQNRQNQQDRQNRRDRRDREGDTSELSPSYRQDSDNEREAERGDMTETREPRTSSGHDSGNVSDDASTESSGDSTRTSAGEAATGSENRDREGSGEASEPRQGRGGGETMRVSVWREKARAEKVLGDDGNEEVRIRKQWFEEEELVEVEDRRQG